MAATTSTRASPRRAWPAIPKVRTVVAVGMPHESLGEVPVAFVVPAHDTVDAASLVRVARERASERAAAPVEVIAIDRLPTTAVGKVYKPELKRLAAQRAVDAWLAREALAVRLVVRLGDDGQLVATLPTEGDAGHVARLVAGLRSLSIAVCPPRGTTDE